MSPPRGDCRRSSEDSEWLKNVWPPVARRAFVFPGLLPWPDKCWIRTNCSRWRSNIRTPWDVSVDRLTELIIRLRDVYLEVGADMSPSRKGAPPRSSPPSFKSLLVPRLMKIFKITTVPHALFLTGRSDSTWHWSACRPDALGVDQECRLETVLPWFPADLPLFSVCGAYNLLAEAKPEEVRAAVRACRSKGPCSPSRRRMFVPRGHRKTGCLCGRGTKWCCLISQAII